jgi:hypothetical protein
MFCRIFPVSGMKTGDVDWSTLDELGQTKEHTRLDIAYRSRFFPPLVADASQ